MQIDSQVNANTHYLERVKNWAYRPDMRTAFSELDNLIGGTDRQVWRAVFLHKNGESLQLIDYPIPDELDY